jgi:hypothetical protein
MTRSFRLTAPDPPEASIQESVARALDALLLPPAFWFSPAIGATKLTPQQAAALSRAGVKRGLPDVLLVHCGLVFGLELKTRKGRLSKTRVGRTRSGAPRVYEGQEDVFPKLREAGMSISVVRSVDEALGQVARWGIPLRARVAA